MASSPPKQKASASEIEGARIAAAKDARFETAFRPLEKDAINELTTADAGKRGKMLAGRTVADLNQEAAGMGMPPVRPGVNVSSGASRADAAQNTAAVSRATSAGITDGFTMGRNSVDADRVNVIATGQNVSRGAQAGFASTARLENQRAQSILAADSVRDRAIGGAVADVATAGLARHSMEKDRATRPGSTPLGGGPPERFAVPDNELNFYSRWLRSRSGG